MLAIKILYKYLHFRNLITLLFFCMEQGLEFRWIWAILGQISKNSEIKKRQADFFYYLGSVPKTKKSVAWQKLPFIQILACFVPYICYYYLPTLFLSLRKRKEFDDTKRIFSFQFIRRKHSQLPIQNFFCGPQKTLRQTWKFSKISLPDLWSVQKRVLFYASFIMKAYILFFYPFATKERGKSLLFLVAFATNMMMI